MKKCDLLPEPKRKKIMAALGKREALLRAQVRSVVQGYTTALFLHGPGGLGKSFIVSSELDSLIGASWQHHTAYTTPKALMLSLASFPGAIHVFEDCEKLYKTDVSSSILRAACGNPKAKSRWVTYETANESLRVNFTGGMVIVSNENLARSRGPLAAVASRFRPIEWNLSVEERMALILDLAALGWNRNRVSLTPDQCMEVAIFLIEEMKLGEIHVPVDIRTYCEHALPAYAQCRGGNAGVKWQDMIRSKLQGAVQQVEKRAEKTNRLQQLAVTITADKTTTAAAKAARWKELTGLGRAIMYRHLRAAKAAPR